MVSHRLKQIEERLRSSPCSLAALALAGLLAAVAYLWRRLRWLPMEEQVVEIDPLVPQAPLHPISDGDRAEGTERDLQLSVTGKGPVFHRRYRVDIARSQRSAAELIQDMKQNLSAYFPPLFVQVEKIAGQPGRLAINDEYDLHLAGPWDAPIRVIDESPTSFTFVTLEGHVEAGEIRFRFVDHLPTA